MEITKVTTITWGSEADEAHEALHAARLEKIQEMASQGKTDPSIFSKIDPVTSKRYWADQSSAEEYISFMAEQAAINNCVIVSAVVEDFTHYF